MFKNKIAAAALLAVLFLILVPAGSQAASRAWSPLSETWRKNGPGMDPNGDPSSEPGSGTSPATAP